MAVLDTTAACGLEVRSRERDVLVDGHVVALTAREFAIIRALGEHPGWVLSAGQLSDADDGGAYSPESVSVHIARLRRKLAHAGAGSAVETVRGLGYRLRASTEDGKACDSTQSHASRALRDAAWQLTEAVLEVEHSGTDAQRAAACDEIERVRHRVYSILAG